MFYLVELYWQHYAERPLRESNTRLLLDKQIYLNHYIKRAWPDKFGFRDIHGYPSPQIQTVLG